MIVRRSKATTFVFVCSSFLFCFLLFLSAYNNTTFSHTKEHTLLFLLAELLLSLGLLSGSALSLVLAVLALGSQLETSPSATEMSGAIIKVGLGHIAELRQHGAILCIHSGDGNSA